ncbi:hypothetical protein QJS66_15145 [Kocuria rhizophila]|nr:hypothetical protein QJS66_15145 [Kocuria rhizophila]
MERWDGLITETERNAWGTLSWTGPPRWTPLRTRRQTAVRHDRVDHVPAGPGLRRRGALTREGRRLHPRCGHPDGVQTWSTPQAAQGGRHTPDLRHPAPHGGGRKTSSRRSPRVPSAASGTSSASCGASRMAAGWSCGDAIGPVPADDRLAIPRASAPRRAERATTLKGDAAGIPSGGVAVFCKRAPIHSQEAGKAWGRADAQDRPQS